MLFVIFNCCRGWKRHRRKNTKDHKSQNSIPFFISIFPSGNIPNLNLKKKAGKSNFSKNMFEHFFFKFDELGACSDLFIYVGSPTEINWKRADTIHQYHHPFSGIYFQINGVRHSSDPRLWKQLIRRHNIFFFFTCAGGRYWPQLSFPWLFRMGRLSTTPHFLSAKYRRRHSTKRKRLLS